MNSVIYREIIEKMQDISMANNSNKFFNAMLNKNHISVDVICNFCKEFNVSSDWLLGISNKNEYLIKYCKNCGKPFHPPKRQDRLYCDRPSPQDITKTCQEYGARQAHQDSLKSNEAMKLYRNIYMTKQMMAKRNPDYAKYQNEFDSFRDAAKKWKSGVKSGAKTENEYVEWLKSTR